MGVSVLSREERHDKKLEESDRVLKITKEHGTYESSIVNEWSNKDPEVLSKCKKPKTGWRDRAKQARQMVATLTSKLVPLPVLGTRNNVCENDCPNHEDGFCNCCGCPKWTKAQTKNKNRYSRHFCPIGLFGVYSDG